MVDSPSRRRDRRRRATGVVIVVLASFVCSGGFIGVVGASDSFTPGPASAAEIGQTSTLQDVSFDIDLADSETTHVEINTSGLPAGASITAIQGVTSSNGDVGATSNGVTGAVANVSVSDQTGLLVDPAVATITVTLDLDTSGLSSEFSGVSYDVDEVGVGSNPDGTVSFDLVDTTAPVYESAITGDLPTGESTANDTVTLNITETGTGINASTVETSDFTVDGSSPTGTGVATVGGQPVIYLTVGTALDTDATPTVDLTGSIDDEAGNTLTGTVSKTAGDGLAPVIATASFNDTDADGTVDRLNVTYSEAISGSYADGDWSIPTAGTVSLSKDGTGSLSSPSMFLEVTGAANTTGGSTPPEVAYSGTTLADTSANANAAQSETVSVTDQAAPINVSVEAKDSNGDDEIDRLNLTYTEDITASTPEQNDYTLGGTDAGSVNITGASTAGLVIQLSVDAPSGTTKLDLTLSYDAAAGAADSVTDGSNPAPSFSDAPVEDATAPTITSTTVLDRDGDGAIDGANVTFSEAIDDGTLTAADYAIDGTGVEAIDTLGTTDDETVQLRITTDANEVAGTDVKDVTYTPGTTADHAGNALGTVGAGTVTETDEASPVVSDFAFAADGRTLTATFDATETLGSAEVDVTGPESASITTFMTSGATHEGSISVDRSGEYTGTLTTAADGAGNGVTTGQSDTATVRIGDNSGGIDFVLTDVYSQKRVDTLTGLVEAGVKFHGTTAASIQAVTPVSGPVGNLDGTYVTGAEIHISESVRDTPASVKLAVSRDRLTSLGVEPETLAVYHRQDDEWVRLQTTVSIRPPVVIIEAATEGFSRFIVMAESPDDRTRSTRTEVAETTPASNEDTATSSGDGREATPASGTPTVTETDGMPGFTVIITLLVLWTTSVFARYRG